MRPLIICRKRIFRGYIRIMETTILNKMPGSYMQGSDERTFHAEHGVR